MSNITQRNRQELRFQIRTYYRKSIQSFYCIEQVIDFVMDNFIYTEDQMDELLNHEKTILSYLS